mmetsp:Transcript_52154/g.77799  ORF Transcript_52154/g.77799 Transcript_52154/m.77799 type:complete len:108 (-) Transcript_52154:92-415(-)
MLEVRQIKDTNTQTENEKSNDITLLKREEVVLKIRELRRYNTACCICFCNFEAGDKLRVIPKCRHEFHLDCIDIWAGTFAEPGHEKCRSSDGPTCPLCNLSLAKCPT